MIETSFDKRIVRYEEIHSIKQEHFDVLCSLLNPIDNQKILDLGAGYGACTREILRHYPNVKFFFTLADNSAVQLERAKREIPQIILDNDSPSSINFELDNIINSKFADDSFDIIIAKMVLHEINKGSQLSALKEIYRILKPNGKFIFWDLYLDNDSREFFQTIINEKDRLCGFDTLYRNRYFLTGKEIFDLFELAGFCKATKELDLMTPIITSKRLKEEFSNNSLLLNEWNTFIREKAKITDPYILFNLSYKDCNEYLMLVPPKAIVTAHKPYE